MDRDFTDKWEVVALLDHAASHIMDSCNELDEPWNDAYNEAQTMLQLHADAARKIAHKASR